MNKKQAFLFGIIDLLVLALIPEESSKTKAPSNAQGF